MLSASLPRRPYPAPAEPLPRGRSVQQLRVDEATTLMLRLSWRWIHADLANGTIGAARLGVVAIAGVVRAAGQARARGWLRGRIRRSSRAAGCWRRGAGGRVLIEPGDKPGRSQADRDREPGEEQHARATGRDNLVASWLRSGRARRGVPAARPGERHQGRFR